MFEISLKASTRGSILRIWSVLETGSDPGLDDSAPISIISAPSLINFFAWSLYAFRLLNLPNSYI